MLSKGLLFSLKYNRMHFEAFYVIAIFKEKISEILYSKIYSNAELCFIIANISH